MCSTGPERVQESAWPLDFLNPVALRAPSVKTGLSFRGPATPHADDHPAGRRAEESTVGSREAGRGSPHHRCGGALARQGQCGASRQATRKRKVDSSVAHPVLWSGKVPVVRSLGMTVRGGTRIFSSGGAAPDPLLRKHLGATAGSGRQYEWAGSEQDLTPSCPRADPSVARNRLRIFRRLRVRSLRKSGACVRNSGIHSMLLTASWRFLFPCRISCQDSCSVHSAAEASSPESAWAESRLSCQP
jgi:hypothetical protein